MRALAAAVLAPLAAAHVPGVRVDQATATWRDAKNRTLLWHGTNFVEKGSPYYPTISDADIASMHTMGMTVVRLGVMMSGLFEKGPTPSEEYMNHTVSIIDRLHQNGLSVIIDLHQDVLAPRVCGEGTPAWMMNVSTLDSLPFPEPLTFNHSIVRKPDPATGDWMPGKHCGAIGLLKFIGWSELYMTDACGKAFQQIYEDRGGMAPFFSLYWKTVSARLRGHPGVLAYEVLNEPWLGDILKHPSLLLEGGASEKKAVGPFMQRMHTVIREQDPDTPVMYAPAEINNRVMRKVGYEKGFLPGEPMAFHVYCITGTDGPGPTTPITKELCHFNDGFQLKTRTDDLKRLGAAGFVTEFGAVSDSPTGLAEVNFVAEHFESSSPPLSWLFWSGVPPAADYKTMLARSYPSAVAGEITSLAFNSNTSVMSLAYTATAGGVTDVVLSRQLRYSKGWNVVTEPEGCCSAADTPTGISVTANNAGAVKVTVSPK